MNRIILIGNGFDLAHGLKTSYGDFIDDYWRMHFSEIAQTKEFSRYECAEFEINQVPIGLRDINQSEIQSGLIRMTHTIRFKNQLLKDLSHMKYDLNWVDIENEYYQMLKSHSKHRNRMNYVVRLNNELTQIEKLLETYLTSVQNKFFDNHADDELVQQIREIIYSEFDLRDFSESSINQKVEAEFQRINSFVSFVEDEDTYIEDISDKDRNLIAALLHKTSSSKRGIIKDYLLSSYADQYFDLQPA